MTRKNGTRASMQQIIEYLGYKKKLEGWQSPRDGKKRSVNACWQIEKKRAQPCGHLNTEIMPNGQCGVCADQARRVGIMTGEAFYG